MGSYRRILLDADLEKAKKYMKGITLDIGGGRERGNFKKPDSATWIVLDIEKKFYPHILGDAQNIPLRSNTVDCVKCTELLEHVEYPEIAINDLIRVLKPGGVMILSMPFLFPIHSDPYDFQRFTDEKIRRILEDKLRILVLKKQGLYFTVLAFMLKHAILKSKSIIKKRLLYPIFPLLDHMVKLDNLTLVRHSKFMSSFTTGFFVIAVKRGEALYD